MTVLQYRVAPCRARDRRSPRCRKSEHGARLQRAPTSAGLQLRLHAADGDAVGDELACALGGELRNHASVAHHARDVGDKQQLRGAERDGDRRRGVVAVDVERRSRASPLPSRLTGEITGR